MRRKEERRVRRAEWEVEWEGEWEERERQIAVAWRDTVGSKEHGR
jgi:hypothetical protein